MDSNVAKVTVYAWDRESIAPAGHCAIKIKYSDDKTYLSFSPKKELPLLDTLICVPSKMPKSYKEDQTDGWCECKADDKVTFYFSYGDSRINLASLKSKYKGQLYHSIQLNCTTVVCEALFYLLDRKISAISPQGVLSEVRKIKQDMIFKSLVCQGCGSHKYYCEHCEEYVCADCEH